MSHNPRTRLSAEKLEALKEMHFTHLVVLVKDVSIRIPGAVEMACTNKLDADHNAERLSGYYNCPGAFEVREI